MPKCEVRHDINAIKCNREALRLKERMQRNFWVYCCTRPHPPSIIFEFITGSVRKCVSKAPRIFMQLNSQVSSSEAENNFKSSRNWNACCGLLLFRFGTNISMI